MKNNLPVQNFQLHRFMLTLVKKIYSCIFTFCLNIVIKIVITVLPSSLIKYLKCVSRLDCILWLCFYRNKQILIRQITVIIILLSVSFIDYKVNNN